MPSLTVSDARRRARTIAVDRYLLDLDLTRGPETFGSTTTILFRRVGADDTTFLDVRPQTLRRVRLNGDDLDVSRLSEGRLRLSGLRYVERVEGVAARGQDVGVHGPDGEFGGVAFLMRVSRGAQKNTRAFVFEFRRGHDAFAHRLFAQTGV